MQRDTSGTPGFMHALHESSIGAVVDSDFTFNVAENNLPSSIIETTSRNLIFADVRVSVYIYIYRERENREYFSYMSNIKIILLLL